jgi:LemA protein
MALYVVLAMVAVLLVALVVVYNRLVRQRNLVADGWAGIDVQLTRRADLVPNLVEVVKGYRLHEQQVLEEVTQARARVQRASGPAASGQADEQLEGSLHTLFAVAEAYPELKANENFLALQTELAKLEEDISFARDYYNALVRRYNTTQQVFPVVLVAGTLGFRQAEYFRAEPGAGVAPRAA